MGCSMKYIDSDNTIIVRTFSGIITMDDVIHSWERIIENCLIGKNIKAIITDYMGVDIKADTIDTDKLSDFFRKNKNLFAGIRIIQVVDSPLIVYPMLLELEFTDLLIKPFSTMKAAMEWATK